MPAWSGLFDDVHGAPHALITARPPVSRLLRVLMQKRGMFGFAEALEDSGGTDFSTITERAVVDPDEGTITAHSGQTGNITNARGGNRAVSNVAVVGDPDDAELHAVMDVHAKKLTYVADLSTNGGAAY
jgi:hypothetical protein